VKQKPPSGRRGLLIAGNYISRFFGAALALAAGFFAAGFLAVVAFFTGIKITSPEKTLQRSAF